MVYVQLPSLRLCKSPISSRISATARTAQSVFCPLKLQVPVISSQEPRIPRPHQHIPRHLKAQPTTRHTGRHLEQIGHNPLIQPPHPLRHNDLLNRVPNTLVLIPHPTHRINLEPPPQHIKRIRNRLRHSTGHRARAQLPHRRRIFLALGGELSPREFVDHEVEADVGRHAGDGGEDAAVEGGEAAFGRVHVFEEGPHAGEFFAAGALEGREGGGLDGEARAHDVERVGEGDGGYACETAAEEALVGAEGGAGFAFEELGAG
jgi:hypothetical protein